MCSEKTITSPKSARLFFVLSLVKSSTQGPVRVSNNCEVLIKNKTIIPRHGHWKNNNPRRRQNKGSISKFHEGYQDRQVPNEGLILQRPIRDNKDEKHNLCVNNVNKNKSEIKTINFGKP